ncbi:MAG: hypothetical protein H6718_13890 [Polyangiaceae bacterium]|nr:hypothetical protein [Myxococcales bacterium]MCB9586489.1 hypothetical protein [Polyangiaceae bacterium]MCB9605996.1 hypothetical protein [Polyangiaceae bacterium]
MAKEAAPSKEAASSKQGAQTNSSELRSRLAANAKRGTHVLSERLEEFAASRSGAPAKIASQAASLVARAGRAIVVDDDALERLGRPGAMPAQRQNEPNKQAGDKLAGAAKRSSSANGSATQESRAAIARAENEGMVP